VDCDNCGKTIRFPLKDARVQRTTHTYDIVVKYYCEECYPKFKTQRDPYEAQTRRR
jgi:hypothetical protein